MDRFDPFVKYADVYGDIINWEKDPMNKPQNQNKYFFSDGKTYYEQICKMLRLMSVFKEAFNQIYSNEDEISEAWENFVNNLSASVVEGSEPDVTLTWTDDSVNFEFTMVPGVQGDPGVGITSISFNSDYTMTITLSDGNTYTSMSLKGETGPQGPQGETGSGLQILDVYATLADLQSAHPTGQPGDAYQVGSAGNYILYIWSSSQSAWVQAGTLGTVSPSTSNPLMDGTASAGSSNLYSRGDHVHPSDTSRASKEELDALIKTSQALIDQSFTYRESPAIQDGLARIDKIKGNTLVWNQLLQNGNFESTSGWATSGRGTLTVSNNVATITPLRSGLIIAGRDISIINGHKYLLSVELKADSTSVWIGLQNNDVHVRINSNGTNQWQRIISLVTNFMNDTSSIPVFGDSRQSEWTSSQIRNYMFIDLTQMFGAGNEPATVEEFTSLFSLPYYDYNAGSLLSFNGTGLKTTGLNQWDGETESGYIYNGVLYASNDYWRTKNYIPVIANKTYYFNVPSTQGQIALYDADKRYISSVNSMGGSTHLVIIPDGCSFAKFYQPVSSDSSTVRVNISSSRNGEYEPYTESTTLLPISTYFPTAMKSVGAVHDELTAKKAITKVGTVDFSSMTWSYNSEYQFWVSSSGLTNAVNASPLMNASIPYNLISTSNLNQHGSRVNGTYNIWVRNGSSTNAPSGIAFYEMTEKTETDVDLDLDFMASENGTEQLLPVNGSVPSTSPIIADMTYLSIDDAMEYVIEKLANVPQNTQQILESLEDDVSDLQTDVGALQPAVSGLQTSVGNINTNIGQLSSTVAGHTASISDIQSDITDLNTGLNDLEDTVTDNTSRIGTLETGLSTTNGNVQSLTSQVQSIDGRVTNLESDLFKVVVKEFDYDTVAPETNFGTTTSITQEEGYRIIGVVGTEAQAGEYTSPASNIAITQCHIHYTSLGALTISIFGRNNGASSRTNVRIYAYLLCIKDIQ